MTTIALDSELTESEFIKKYSSDPDFGESTEMIFYLKVRWNYFYNKASKYVFEDVYSAYKKTHLFKSITQ